MMRLKEPTFKYKAVLDTCVEEIGNANLKLKLSLSMESLLAASIKYEEAARAGALCSIKALRPGTAGEEEVLKGLTKDDLIKLYDRYFVRKEKARQIYDAILNAAEERCPFCGGIGRPRNLDHFLPKAHFPQYSVLPINLVPSCRDCNMEGKASAFSEQLEEQIIQPYLDNSIFFADQWIFATYESPNERIPGTLRYFTQPPDHWPEVAKLRVEKHFRDFYLAKRYAVKGSEQTPIIISQIAILRDIGLSPELISSTVLSPAIENAPFVNHWHTGLYQALNAWLRER